MKTKIIKMICISVVILFLSTPFISANQVKKPSNIKDKDYEPKWGAWRMDIDVKEEYGSPTTPLYRPLSNATVYIWNYDNWILPNFRTYLIKFIWYYTPLPIITKKAIFRNWAYEIHITGETGWVRISGYSGGPFSFLVYVDKEGYHVNNGLFKDGWAALVGEPNCIVYFTLRKD